PTLLDLARSSLPGTSPPVDGESLVPVLLDALPTGRWRDAVLLELASPIPANVQPHDVPRYSAVRTRQHLYVEYETGEVELYDLGADPHQLDSMHDSAPPDLLARLQDQLEALRDCEGTGCTTAARLD
ncbi:MAG: DUF4976 domain-containing protein, partial [Acidimicrobiia bacterium]|nr:DUF4976 domain-containing protein [Acidimicrobiia bacterium]